MGRFLIALFGVTLCLPAFGHELGLVQVEGSFQKDGTYIVDLLVDREHMPPQVTWPAAFLTSIDKSAVLSFDGKQAAHGIGEVMKVDGKSNISRLRLTGRTPSHVSRFTFADAALLPQLYASRRFATVDAERYPTLLRVETHCLSLDFVQKARPENQPDAVNT
jgi:hypothetical protein